MSEEQGSKVRALPEGFTLEPFGTTAGGHKYTVEVPQAGPLEVPKDFDVASIAPIYAIIKAYNDEGKNGPEVMRLNWNSGNAQGGKQGQKAPVLKAVEDKGDVVKEVKTHQAKSKGFIQGAPRGGGGARHATGLTGKQREEYGTAMVMEMQRTKGAVSKARSDEIAEKLGIDPSLLGYQGD